MSHKQHYVVGFLFDHNYKNVALIMQSEKKEEWQNGLLNGVGGHIKEGELPNIAMDREGLEEAGVSDVEWIYTDTSDNMQFAMHVYCARAKGPLELKSSKEGEVAWHPVEPLLQQPQTLVGGAETVHFIKHCLNELRLRDPARQAQSGILSEYRIASSELFYAPGWLKQMQHIYRTDPEIAFWSLAIGCPWLPAMLIKDLLADRTKFDIVSVHGGSTVVIRDWAPGPTENYFKAPPPEDNGE